MIENGDDSDYSDDDKENDKDYEPTQEDYSQLKADVEMLVVCINVFQCDISNGYDFFNNQFFQWLIFLVQKSGNGKKVSTILRCRW